jgi:hypothetical protein
LALNQDKFDIKKLTTALRMRKITKPAGARAMSERVGSPRSPRSLLVVFQDFLKCLGIRMIMVIVAA